MADDTSKSEINAYDQFMNVEEELVYITECLLEGLTDEAKLVLNDLCDYIHNATGISEQSSTLLIEWVNSILSGFEEAGPTSAACSQLVVLRRRVTNTLRRMEGKTSTYDGAEPLS